MTNNLGPNNNSKIDRRTRGQHGRVSDYYRPQPEQRDIEVEHPSPNTIESSINLRPRRLSRALLSQHSDEQNITEIGQDVEKTDNTYLHNDAQNFLDPHQVDSINESIFQYIENSVGNVPFRGELEGELQSIDSDLQNLIDRKKEEAKKEAYSLHDDTQDAIENNRTTKSLIKGTKKARIKTILNNALKRRLRGTHRNDMTSRILKRFDEKIFIENDFLSSNSSKFLKEILIKFSLSKQNTKSISSFLAEVLKADSFLRVLSKKELHDINEVKEQVDSLDVLIANTQNRKGAASEINKIFKLWEELSCSFEAISPHMRHFFSESRYEKDALPSQLRERLSECEDIYQYLKVHIFSDLEDTSTRNLSKILEGCFSTKVKGDSIFTSLPENVITSIVAHTIRSIYRYNNDVLCSHMKQLSFDNFLDLLNGHVNMRDLFQGINGVPSTVLLSSGSLKFSFKPLLSLQRDWFNNFDKLRAALTPVMSLLNELKGKFRAFRAKNGDFVVLIRFPRAKKFNSYSKGVSDDFYSRFSQAQQDELNNVKISFPLKNKKDSKQTTNILFPISCIKEGESFVRDLREVEKLASFSNLHALSIENSDGMVQNSLFQDVLMFFRENNSSEAFIRIPRYFLEDRKIVESLASTFKFSNVNITIPFLSGASVMGSTDICHALSVLISNFEDNTQYDLGKMQLVCTMKPLSTECIIFDKKGNTVLSATYDIKEKKFVLKDQ